MSEEDLNLKDMDPQRYYDWAGEEEWERLEENFLNSLEFKNTLFYLDKFLPESGKILDAGGGPGRYAIWLAERGYDVTLIDISKEQRNIARDKAKEFGLEDKITVEGGDIRNLKFNDDEFDSVLCLSGPLSHILEEEERKSAVEELKRVGKPGAPVFISVIGLFSAIKKVMECYPPEISTLPEVLESGNYTTEMVEKYDLKPTFAESHFFRRKEFRGLLKGEGLHVKKIVGIEGLPINNPEVLEELEDEKKAVLEDLSERMREDPALAEFSNHMLAVTVVPSSSKSG